MKEEEQREGTKLSACHQNEIGALQTLAGQYVQARFLSLLAASAPLFLSQNTSATTSLTVVERLETQNDVAGAQDLYQREATKEAHGFDRHSVLPLQGQRDLQGDLRGEKMMQIEVESEVGMDVDD